MRSRPPAVAVLGVVGILAAGAAALAIETAPSAPSSATAFARSVLAEATVPPGGRPTKGPRTSYLYDEPPATVVRYVETHLPPGAILSGYGTHVSARGGVVTVVTETLPVSGPDEHMAALAYQVVATNGPEPRSELRIDAHTVWVPPRSGSELATDGETVQVTGYKTASVTRLHPSGPVTVVLSPSRATTLIRAFDSLPLGPPSVACLEDATDFSIVIRSRLGVGAPFSVTGYACGDSVGVSENGKTGPSLWDQHCALIEAVDAALPARATATKSAEGVCSRSHSRRGLPPPTSESLSEGFDDS